jgi:hypothetical protein
MSTRCGKNSIRTGILLPVLAFALASASGAERRLFVSDDRFFLVWTFDVETGEVVRAFSAPLESMGSTLPAGRSALAFDGEHLYYTRNSSSLIWVLDPRSGAVRRTLPKPPVDIGGLTAAGGRLYAVASPGLPGALHTIDAATGELLASVDIPGARDAVAAAADEGVLYLKVGELEIRRVDIESGEARGFLTPPASFSGLAYDPNGQRLAGMVWGGRVFWLDPQTAELRETLDLVDASGGALASCADLAIGELEDPVEEPPPGRVQAQLPDPGGAPVDGPVAVFQVQDSVVIAGTPTRVPFLLTTSQEVQGFVLAAVHEPAVLRLEEVTVKDTATERFRADFVASEILPNGGTLGVVFDLAPPFEDNHLPAGDNYVVAAYVYSCTDRDLREVRRTEVRLIDGVLGSPPKSNIVILQGLSVLPVLFGGRVACHPQVGPPGGPEFFCGGPLGPDGLPGRLESHRGDRFEVCFYYSFPEPQGERIQGLSMAIAFDCRLRCIEESFRVPAESITALVAADFVDFHCESDPDDGDGCEMVLGLLVDSVPPFDAAVLPPSDSPLLVACVELEVGVSAQVGDCLEIHFRDEVDGRGRVPVRNLVALDDHSFPARGHPCEVCVVEAKPGLLCGSSRLDVRGEPEPVVGGLGEEVEVCLWYSSPAEPVFSLTQAIRFDCRLECVEGSFQVAPEFQVLMDEGRIAFECENDGSDGDPCELVLRISGDPAPAAEPLLPAANVPRRLGCLRMRIRGEAPSGVCLPLEHHDGTNGAGTFLHSNRVELASGFVSPQLFDCRVCVLPAPPPTFFCGGPTLGIDGLPAPILDVERGGRAELCFYYTSPPNELTREDELQGLSMAICFDCNLTCIEGSFHVPPDSVLALVGAEFIEFHCDNDPDDGDGCEMVLGILVDFLPPFEANTLPPTNVPLKVACVDVEVEPLAKLGFCLPVEFCEQADGRGFVPIKNLVAAENHSRPPATEDCEVCVQRLGPCFFCGGPELGPDGVPLPAVGEAGGLAEVCFWYTAPNGGPGREGLQNPIQGLSIAVAFDCRLRCIEDSVRFPPDAVTTLVGAEFLALQCDNDPADGDGCELILAILVDAEPPFDGQTLPPTDVPLKLACLDFQLPESAVCGDCFPVRFQDGVDGRGRVPAFNLVAIDNHSFLACTFDCLVCTTELPVPVFRRGDCNANGMVEISDAADIISALFGRGPWQSLPPCLDACDVNDDGRVDLADAYAILQYLFLQGREPPAPGPEMLGSDPTEDKIDCDDVEDPCPQINARSV